MLVITDILPHLGLKIRLNVIQPVITFCHPAIFVKTILRFARCQNKKKSGPPILSFVEKRSAFALRAQQYHTLLHYIKHASKHPPLHQPKPYTQK